MDTITDLRAQIARLTAERDEAREALKRYGKHDGLCAFIGGYGYCDCGLDTIKGTDNANG